MSIMEFASTGIAGLDEVLGQGFRCKRVHFVQGPSGSGKTTLALQFLMAGAHRGEKALFIGTSESREEIELIAASHGWSLEGVSVRRHAPEEIAGREPGQTIFHPAEVELPRTVEAIMKIIGEENPRRLVIDSLAEIRVMAQEPDWYRRQLSVLERELSKLQCTTLLTDLPATAQDLVKSLVSSSIRLATVTPVYGPDRRRLLVEKTRGHSALLGYHDYRIVRGGLEVYPRLVAAEHRTRFDTRVSSTGSELLDAQLGGGLTQGTSTLVMGPAGTGKSALATQFAVACAERGENSAMFIFDERVQTLFSRARGLGIDLEKHVANGLIEIRQVDPAEVTPGEFGEIIRRQVKDRQIQLLIIDSLSGYRHAMTDERFLAVHLHELSSYLSQKAVNSVFTLAQHGFLTPGENHLELSYLADTVIQLRYFERKGSVQKAISVVKRRCGPHERTARAFDIGPSGLNIGDIIPHLGVVWGLNPYPDSESD